MAAHGHIHRTKKAYHLIVRDPELTCHVMNTKLAQTCLLSRARRASQPTGARLCRRRQRANAAREISIQNTYRNRGLTSYRCAKFRRRRHFQLVNAASIQQRNQLVQAMSRGVHRHHGKPQATTQSGLAHLLNANYGRACANTQAHKPQQLPILLLFQSQLPPPDSGPVSPRSAAPSTAAPSSLVEPDGASASAASTAAP